MLDLQNFLLTDKWPKTFSSDDYFFRVCVHSIYFQLIYIGVGQLVEIL